MDVKLSPDDNLWLGILLSDESLSSRGDDDARKSLRDGGFPEPVIDEYLKVRADEEAIEC